MRRREFITTALLIEFKAQWDVEIGTEKLQKAQALGCRDD